MIESGLLSTDVEREMFFGRAITIVYPPMSLNIEAGRGRESSLFPNGLIAPHIRLAVALCPIAVVRGRGGRVCRIDGQ